jgi:hypothetical protein
VRRFPYYIHALIVIALILSAWLPFINPKHLWPSGLIGLAFPLFWCLNLLFIPFWIFRKKRFFWLSVAGMLLSLNASYHSFGLHPGANGKSDFTIMTFNTSSMGLKDYKEDTHITTLQVIKQAGIPGITALYSSPAILLSMQLKYPVA